MKKIIVIIILCIGIYGLSSNYPAIKSFIPFTNQEFSTGDETIKKAFDNRYKNFQVGGSGKVVRILSDDNKGSRHQRFIIQLDSGQTLLLAHNIDLAPRIKALKLGDHIHFYGEYEWNSKGGVIHWTHHDPNGRHEAGWLKHEGKMYQ